MFFSNIEVDEVIANRSSYAPTTKRKILSFVSKYKTWGVSKGDISNNSVNAIDWYETSKSMTNVLINKVWGLGEFYNLMVRIESESELFTENIKFYYCCFK